MRFRRPAAITVLVLLLAAGLGLPTASAAEAPHPAQQQNTTRSFATGGSSATLGSRTILLTSEDISSLHRESTTTLAVQHRTANLDLVGVGSKLLGQSSPEFPKGIMYNVTAVSNTPAGGSIYTVTPAPLSEVFATLNVNTSRTLSLKTATLVGPNANGCSIGLTSLDCGIELGSDKISAGASLPSNISVEAKHRVAARLTANLNPTVNISASTQQISTTFAVAPTLSMDVSAEMEQEVSRSWQIPGIDFPTFTVWVGPVPIVVSPKLELELKAAGSVSAGLNLHYGFSQTFSAGLIARAGGGVSVTKNVGTPVFSHSETLSGKATLQFSVAFTLYVQLDELAGPTLTFEPGIKLTINPFATGDPGKKDWWWKLEGVGSLSIGGKISILDTVLAEGSYQLWSTTDNQFILAHAADKTPYVGVTFVDGVKQVRANSARVPLTAYTKGDTGVITWKVDSNSTNARLAPCAGVQCRPTLALAGRTLYFVPPVRSVGAYTLTVTPQRGQSNHVTIMVVPGDPKIPTVPLGLSATPKMDAADVSWKAPATDNFAEVDSYTLTATSPGQKTRTVTVPGGVSAVYSARIPYLAAGRVYTVNVKAHNRMGFSPPATITVTPLGRLRTKGDMNIITPKFDASRGITMSSNGATMLTCLPADSPLLPVGDRQGSAQLVQAAYTTAAKTWRSISTPFALLTCDGDPSITADGTTALYRIDNTLYKYNVTGRTLRIVPTPIRDWGVGYNAQYAMSKDGSTIAIVENGHIWRSVNNGPFLNVPTTCPEDYCTQWSPAAHLGTTPAGIDMSADGKTISFNAFYQSHQPTSDKVKCSDVQGVYVWREATKKTVRITPDEYNGCAASYYWDSTVSSDGTTFAVKSYGRALVGSEKNMQTIPYTMLPPGGQKYSSNVALSGNGRFVTFLYNPGASPNTKYNVQQPWVYDRWTGIATPLSTSENDSSIDTPSINDSGTYVAWVGADYTQPNYNPTVVSRAITAT